MRGRGGSRRKSRVQNQVRKTVRAEHQRDYRGVLAAGRADPGRVLLNPWNTITLSTIILGTASPTNTCLTIDKMHAFFLSQTGITTINNAYRIISAKLWHLVPNGEVNNVLRVRFYSFIDAASSCDLIRTLASVEDYGTPARHAVVSFTWPKVHQSAVKSYADTSQVLRLAQQSNQQTYMQLTVLWKPLGAASSVYKDGVITRDPVSELHNDESDVLSPSLSQLSII